MADSIATAVVDLKINTKGLQQGLNRVKGTLAGSTVAIGGMAAGTTALTSGLAAAGGVALTTAHKLSPMQTAFQDFKKTFPSINKSFEEFSEHVSGVPAEEAANGLVKVGTAATATTTKFQSLAAAAKAAWMAIAAIAFITGKVVKSSFTAAAEIETLTNKFINLGVSAKDAAAHMANLQAYTNVTSFDIASVAKASAILFQFSGGVLGGVESVKLIGEAADVAGKSITDIAVQVGKLYAALQAGGEGASEPINVLRDMGAVSAITAGKMKQLMKVEGEQIAIFKLLMDDMEKRSGASARSATSLAGAMSTMKDAWKNAWSEMGTSMKPTYQFMISSMAFVAERMKELTQSIIYSYALIGALSDKFKIGDPKRLLGLNLNDLREAAKIAKEMAFAGELAAEGGGGLGGGVDLKLSPEQRAEKIKKSLKDVWLKERESAKSLNELQKSYQTELKASILSRMSAEDKIASLNKEYRSILKIAYGDATKSDEARYEAKKKLLVLEEQIAAVKEKKDSIKTKAEEAMSALRDARTKEKSDSEKGLGFTGKFVGGEEAIKFSQQVQSDAMKSEEKHNKAMEKFQEKQIKLQEKYGPALIAAIEKGYDLGAGGDSDLSPVF